MSHTHIFSAEAPRECGLCPRLVAFRQDCKAKLPKGYNGAVPSFGDEGAELLIIGLAPGMGGANMTGRPFTGDWAGDLLYATLAKFGFSEGVYKARPDDGLVLKHAMITNAVRCLPPQNKPIGAEINTCRDFLKARIAALPRLKAIIALGKIAHDSTVRALELKLKDHPFGHGVHYQISLPASQTLKAGRVDFLSSYHCSRYNTNTRRLTTEMFEDVFAKAKACLTQT